MKFDKQNDPLRRKQIFQYDALTYSLLRRDGECVLTLIILGSNNTQLVHPLIEAAQQDYLNRLAKRNQDNKRLRDDIAVSVLNIINLLDDSSMKIILDDKIVTKQQLLNIMK